MKQIHLPTFLALLTGQVLSAQQIADPAQPYVPFKIEVAATDASYIIFSNLVRKRDARFNSDAAFTIAGKDASVTEQWFAIRFVPKADVQATVLSAAIGYTSGTKLVTLGIYTEDPNLGTVGDPLPGGQGSTTKIPDLEDCCQLATVMLEGSGVTLSKDTPYWLVVGPDNVNGGSFYGGWRLSSLAISANQTPPFHWTVPHGSWPAAEIRGTKLQAFAPSEAAKGLRSELAETNAPGRNIKIFTSLDRTSPYLYSFGAGALIAGNDVQFEPEAWQALPFTPRADVHAKTLAAAIAWSSGTRLVNLGVYTDNAGAPGTPLPDGQGSTTEIPDLGDCCDLTEVTLDGAGVALSKNVQYWLVASPDNVNAPTFEGAWQDSILALTAYQNPENFINWTTLSGLWFAAEIRGTSP